ncbi:MAG: Endonuclease NucS [Candidatus Heimdallarchaeota archaeon LC_3]|nr:MAG: Endonuclease NucS [Candidatus Heimdallarchaeota archaeon LC_3]
MLSNLYEFTLMTSNKKYVIDIDLDYENIVQKIEHFLGKFLLEIYGNCSAVFDGRIKSTLGLGDRLLIIKIDQTILLHELRSLKPINWQLPGVGKLEFKLINSGENKQDIKQTNNYLLELYTFRPKTNESFTVVFENIYSLRAITGRENSEINIEGNEADMQSYLVQNPSLIEDDIKIINREYNTPIGKIDLIGKDKNGKTVLIELKKSLITPADAFQIVRYREIIMKIWNKPENIRSMIIGSKISEKLYFYLKEHEIEFKEIKWNEIFPSIPRKKKKKLNDFFSKNT